MNVTAKEMVHIKTAKYLATPAVHSGYSPLLISEHCIALLVATYRVLHAAYI